MRRSAISRARRGAPGDDLQRRLVEDAAVAVLHQEPARDRADGQRSRARIGQRAGDQQPQVLLRRDDRQRLVVGLRRDDDLGEDLDDLSRRRGVEAAVQRDDAAEGRDRIAGERLFVGLEQGRADRDAAGVGVLDDGDRRAFGRIELGDEFVGRVGVVDVVVGQLLALDLPRGRDARRASRR